MSGVEVVLLERFDAARVLDLIERHRITGFVGATPMLQRLSQVPGMDEPRPVVARLGAAGGSVPARLARPTMV